MQILSIIRIVGLLGALFSSTMLLPAMVAFGYRDGGGTEFVNSFVIALLLGLLLAGFSVMAWAMSQPEWPNGEGPR